MTHAFPKSVYTLWLVHGKDEKTKPNEEGTILGGLQAVVAAANDDNDYDEIEKVVQYGLVRWYVMVYQDVPLTQKYTQLRARS